MNAQEIGKVQPGVFQGKLCLFSKFFPQMSCRELARAAKQAGFDGIDLTVRTGGHVRPQNAVTELPKAVETIRAEGLEVPMITTELISVRDSTAKPLLETAARLAIPYFKFGYYHYQFVDVRRELEAAGNEFRKLVELAGQFGIQGGYHNHPMYIGAPVWDIATIMDTLDPRWVGYYFDLRNSTEEGAIGGWKIATNLVMPRLKMVGVKDFYWQKTARGWIDKGCPLGEGMCHWEDFYKALAAAKFHGPVTLHLEYETAGVMDEEGVALSRSQADVVMTFAQRDLKVLKRGLLEAYKQA